MKIPAGLSQYQRKCVAAMLDEGYEIVGLGRLDGEWATLVMRRGSYENRVAFPRSKSIEDYYSAYSTA